MKEESIFAEAITKQTPGERAAYLDGACGRDKQLRNRIEQLLVAHAHPDEFFEALPPGVERDVEQTMAHSPSHMGTGTRIGRYKLLEEIGEGGMGTVWVAEQSEPVRRKVALKLVKPGMDSRQVVARFNAERQALAVMDHPNIAKVYDGGLTEQGRPYFVMEYVKGVPLTEYCDQAKLSLRERLQLFVPVCQAVQHAHQKGIIHRDLKPSNILACLYDGKPVPKVIDFGLAKAMHQPLTEQTLHTAHGMMLGTPMYMSPEQAEFNNLDVDTRTDIYSLGVILYELLTGTTPLEKQQFKEAAMNEILRLIKEVEPPKPSTRLSGSASLPSIAAQRSLDAAQLRRSVRGDLDWIVMKALDKERSRRYETANGLARDIERFLNEEAVEACPPSASYRLRKFAKKNRTVLATVGAFAALLLVSTLVSSWLAWERSIAVGNAQASEEKAKEHRKIAEDQATLAQVAKADAIEEARKSKRQQYISDMLAASAAFGENDIERVEETLRRGIPANEGSEHDLRGPEWYCLWGMCERTIRAKRIKVKDIVLATSFSPDGKELAVGHGDNSFTLIDMETGQTQSFGNRLGWGSFIGYSPIGNTLVFPGEDANRAIVNVWNRQSGETRTLLNKGEVFKPVAIGGGGKLIATGSNSSIRIWSVTTCEQLQILAAEQSAVTSVAFSPSGDRFAAGHQNGHVHIWNMIDETITESETITVQHMETQAIESLAFSLDGKILAAASAANSVLVWDAATGTFLNKLSGHGDDVRAVAFSPTDSELLASGSRDQTVRLWNVADLSERAVLRGTWVGHPLSFSPDGRWIATAGHREVILWDIGSDVPTDTVRTGQAVVELKFFPAGRSFAALIKSPVELGVSSVKFRESPSTVSLWDTKRREHRRTLFADAIVRCIDISPQSILAVGTTKGQIRFWNETQERELEPISVDTESEITSISFSPNGEGLGIGLRSGRVAYWDGATIRYLGQPEDSHRRLVTCVRFMPESKLLATASLDHTIKLWDIESRQFVRTLPPRHNDWVAALDFTSTGRYMASAGWDGSIWIWDCLTWNEPRRVAGDAMAMHSVTFLRNNKTLVTSSGTNKVKLWDIQDGQELLNITGHESGVFCAAVSPDEDLLITGGKDNSIRFWPIANEKQVIDVGWYGDTGASAK